MRYGNRYLSFDSIGSSVRRPQIRILFQHVGPYYYFIARCTLIARKAAPTLLRVTWALLKLVVQIVLAVTATLREPNYVRRSSLCSCLLHSSILDAGMYYITALLSGWVSTRYHSRHCCNMGYLIHTKSSASWRTITAESCENSTRSESDLNTGLEIAQFHVVNVQRTPVLSASLHHRTECFVVGSGDWPACWEIPGRRWPNAVNDSAYSVVYNAKSKQWRSRVVYITPPDKIQTANVRVAFLGSGVRSRDPKHDKRSHARRSTAWTEIRLWCSPRSQWSTEVRNIGFERFGPFPCLTKICPESI